MLEQLDRDTTFSLERFVVLLDILKMGMLVLIIIKGFGRWLLKVIKKCILIHH